MLETFSRDGMSARSNTLGLVPARGALGATMLYHGLQKLKDREKAGNSFHAIGISPGKPWALATALAEVFAGASALLGILTRPAALAVLVTQSVAIAKVHRQKGFDVTKGGYEFNVALMAIAAGLLLGGPGRLSVYESVDGALTKRRSPLFARRRPRSVLGRILAALVR